MNVKDIAEAFGEVPPEGVEVEAELDDAVEPETVSDEAVQADADVFFDASEDSGTRLEALRRLIRKLK